MIVVYKAAAVSEASAEAAALLAAADAGSRFGPQAATTTAAAHSGSARLQGIALLKVRVMGSIISSQQQQLQRPVGGFVTTRDALTVSSSGSSSSRDQQQAPSPTPPNIGLEEADDPLEQLPISIVRISNRTVLEALQSDARIEAVILNTLLQPTLSNSLPLVKQPKAYSSGFRGAGCSVAVLDTGEQQPSFGFRWCLDTVPPLETLRIQS